MQGIDQDIKDDLEREQYPMIWNMRVMGKTYKEIANEFDLTKQRVHQIIAYMKIGEGDYYKGRLEARQKRKELDKKEFKLWLKLKGLKVSVNNKKFSTYA
jgi:truncated hemoglobin YjbI|tara:strand:- start:1038 stop:1337 length:300 start_codon:yes stop_codon:yes gene_type:complete